MPTSDSVVFGEERGCVWLRRWSDALISVDFCLAGASFVHLLSQCVLGLYKVHYVMNHGSKIVWLALPFK